MVYILLDPTPKGVGYDIYIFNCSHRGMLARRFKHYCLLPIVSCLLPLLERFDGGVFFQKSGARMNVDVFDSHGTNRQIKADAFLRRPVKLDV